MTPQFSYSHVIEADVSAAAIWALYDDVSTWPAWDAQAEWVTRRARSRPVRAAR